mgnify:CR=1 FL=1
MTTSGCSKKKTKQKNTLRAITDNADSKRERDKKVGPNLNYFFMKPQVNKLLSLLSVTKKQKRGNQSLCYKKKNRNQSNLTWGI